MVDPESYEADGTEVLGVMRRVAVDRSPGRAAGVLSAPAGSAERMVALTAAGVALSSGGQRLCRRVC